MLISSKRLIGTPILSIEDSRPVATISSCVIEPNSLKILAFYLSGPFVSKSPANLLDTMSIREYSRQGCIINSTSDFIEPDDVVRIKKVLELNFDLIGLKVETKKGSKLGRVTDYTIDSNDFSVQQIIVRRPSFKAFFDPELTISRREIVEITDYKVIIKDEEKVIKSRAEKEDFIPNFVNPFRENKQDFIKPENNSDSN